MANEIKIQLTKDLYESPMRERNLEKYGDNSDNCICCGKKLNLDSCFWVHMNTDWMAVNPSIVNDENCAELTGANSQGCFPIGPDCAKKMTGFIYPL
jgi:hypothetical protein